MRRDIIITALYGKGPTGALAQLSAYENKGDNVCSINFALSKQPEREATDLVKFIEANYKDWDANTGASLKDGMSILQGWISQFEDIRVTMESSNLDSLLSGIYEELGIKMLWKIVALVPSKLFVDELIHEGKSYSSHSFREGKAFSVMVLDDVRKYLCDNCYSHVSKTAFTLCMKQIAEILEYSDSGIESVVIIPPNMLIACPRCQHQFAWEEWEKRVSISE